MHLEVQPITAINAPLPIQVGDVDPGAIVHLAYQATDHAGHVFETTQRFQADATGHVDTATSLPRTAAWHPAHSLGPVWVMSGPGVGFCLHGAKGITLTVTARTKGQPGAMTTVQRIFSRTIAPFAVAGFGGYQPTRGAGHPVVLLLGDAVGQPHPEGADLDAAAAELAGEGFRVLTAGWALGAGEQIAVADCLAQVRDLIAACGPIALVGMGRGAELALLLAGEISRTAPQDLYAVVAHSPSDIVTLTPHPRRPEPTFSDREALAADSSFGVGWQAFLQPTLTGKPWEIGSFYSRAREHATEDALAAATIDIHALQAPLLLTAGEGDAVWDAPRACRRLAHAATCEVFTKLYEHAGYGIGYPFSFGGLPQHATITLYGHKVATGGTPADRGAAAGASKEQVTSFLRSAADAATEDTHSPTP
ncbi:acyl-CoA thioesterase/BAAT N-terminal domain-containing protein [Corynebacterium sp. 13CS0277]|uniref:acyl-CoA thioesterase/BAAT N-terminal domain-containing protein n=1 Tax=Corynebacterium sp. 13CS0277 TaxID=2071994 RepID=UPI001304D3F3|nr:acyl-CoA thioesterase/BAAT N-terminal domain-containing protein [Corynebacterium sp. 13CS0277]